MRRFELIQGGDEPALEQSPQGIWVPVSDHEKLLDELERIATQWGDEGDVSYHVSSYLKSMVTRARDKGDDL